MGSAEPRTTAETRWASESRIAAALGALLVTGLFVVGLLVYALSRGDSQTPRALSAPPSTRDQIAAPPAGELTEVSESTPDGVGALGIASARRRSPSAAARPGAPAPSPREDSAPEPAETFLLRGRLDVAPAASGNLELDLRPLGECRPLHLARTSLNGQFRFEGLPAGEYVLGVRLPPAEARYARFEAWTWTLCLERDLDLGLLRAMGPTLVQSQDADIDTSTAWIVVELAQSGRAPRGLRVLAREAGGGAVMDSVRLDLNGRARVEWRVDYGPVRLYVVDSEGTPLAATPSAQSYPYGVETVVRLAVSTGALAVHLAPQVEIPEGARLQVLLEGSGLPSDSEPCATLSERGAARTDRSGSSCDAWFPALLAGTYTVRTRLLERRADGTWFPAEAGPRRRVRVSEGETAVLRFGGRR